MAITLTIEDGTIVTGANSYADLLDAVVVNYFEAHLYATAWTGATDEQKKAALVMATRYLDTLVVWNGQRVEATQPRAWPRQNVYLDGDYLAEDAIPQDIIEASLEVALAFLTGNRIADTAKAKGVASIGLGNGALDLQFTEPDPVANLPIIPEQVTMMLLRYGGSVSSGFRQVPISR